MITLFLWKRSTKLCVESSFKNGEAWSCSIASSAHFSLHTTIRARTYVRTYARLFTSLVHSFRILLQLVGTSDGSWESFQPALSFVRRKLFHARTTCAFFQFLKEPRQFMWSLFIKYDDPPTPRQQFCVPRHPCGLQETRLPPPQSLDGVLKSYFDSCFSILISFLRHKAVDKRRNHWNHANTCTWRETLLICWTAYTCL